MASSSSNVTSLRRALTQAGILWTIMDDEDTLRERLQGSSSWLPLERAFSNTSTFSKLAVK